MEHWEKDKNIVRSWVFFRSPCVTLHCPNIPLLTLLPSSLPPLPPPLPSSSPHPLRSPPPPLPSPPPPPLPPHPFSPFIHVNVGVSGGGVTGYSERCPSSGRYPCGRCWWCYRRDRVWLLACGGRGLRGETHGMAWHTRGDTSYICR